MTFRQIKDLTSWFYMDRCVLEMDANPKDIGAISTWKILLKNILIGYHQFQNWHLVTVLDG